MESKPLTLRRIPKYERIHRMAERYPLLGLNPIVIQADVVLMGVAREVAAALGRNLAHHGLGEGRFLVLTHLLEHQPKTLSQTELAELSGVTKGNITGLVDRLERDGYVKRENSGNDRRVTPISLTPAGSQLIEKTLADLFRRMNGLMSELSDSECKTLVSLLTKVQAGLPALKPE